MYFYRTTGILFFMFQVKDILSAQEICLENDITIHLNEWVTSMFAIGYKNVTHIFSAIRDDGLKQFEYNISNTKNHSLIKLRFFDIQFWTYDVEDEQSIPQIQWKFPENIFSVFFEEFHIRVEGKIRLVVVNGEKFSHSVIYPSFENFTLTAVGSHIKDNDLKISYDTTCNSINIWKQTSLFFGNITADCRQQLDQEIKPAMSAMLQDIFSNNQKLSRQLEKVFQAYERPRKEIISIHSDFLSNSQQYYYLIPKIPFFCFILKRVVISGLTNFESFKVVQGIPGMFTHTLLIRNVQGRMTLDYRSENEPALELNFQIDCFVLSKRDDTDCVHGQAKYYSITRTKTNTLLSPRQSETMMNRLESAIASTLLSSKKIARICELQMPLEKIEISNCSDWKSIKESYKGWIPFNGDEAVKKDPLGYVKIIS